MDPNACLTAADQALSDLELDTAQERLDDYAEWRRRGGFEPIEVAGTTMRGDAFAAWCGNRLTDMRAQEERQ